MSVNQQNEIKQLSIVDKWRQLKTWTELQRFPMMIFYPSKWKTEWHDSCKIRGTRINWNSSDNACLNFFSGAEVRREFLSHREHYHQKEKKFKDIFWEKRDKMFRLFFKNINKEKLLILYLDDITEVTRITFYFKYQLQLKKNIDFYDRHIDLAMVWKTRHYYQPLLTRMRQFGLKYKGVSKEQLNAELDLVKQMQQKREDPAVVESKLDLVLIKETTADNEAQITFQILDFQIVGVIAIDKDLIKSDEIGPLRAYGPGGINEILREKERELEIELQAQKNKMNKEDFIRQKSIATDFKKQMTRMAAQRKKKKNQEQETLPEESKGESSIDIYASHQSDADKEKKDNLRAEQIPIELGKSQSFKKIKPIKKNIFDTNPQENNFMSSFLKTDHKFGKENDKKKNRSKSANLPKRSSGTVQNRSGRRRPEPKFQAATGQQMNNSNKDQCSDSEVASIGTFYLIILFN